MADIVTNTLQIGNDKLILRDADAQEKVTGLKEDLNESVSDLKSAFVNSKDADDVYDVYLVDDVVTSGYRNVNNDISVDNNWQISTFSCAYGDKFHFYTNGHPSPVRTIVAFGANDNVLESFRATEDEFDWTAPIGAVKVDFSYCVAIGRRHYTKKKTIVNPEGYNIYGKYIPITAVNTQSGYVNTNEIITTSSWHTVDIIDVSDYEKYRITMTVSSAVVGIMLKDLNNKVSRTIQQTSFEGYELVIRPGETKLYVSHNNGVAPIEKMISVVPELVAESDNNLAYVQIQPESVSDGYINTNGSVQSNANWGILQFSVRENEQYRIKSRGGTESSTVYITDADGNKVFAKTGNLVSGFEFTIPSDAKIMKVSTAWTYGIPCIVEKIMPKMDACYHVACYGDSLTFGNQDGTNVWYPDELKKLIKYGKYIWTVERNGFGGDKSVEIATMQGGIPLYVAPFDIPADTTAVEISFICGDSSFDSDYVPADQNMGYLSNVKISGVSGAITRASGKYFFARAEDGDAVSVTRPALVYTHGYDIRDSIQIFWAGTNDSITTETVDNLVDRINDMINFLTTSKYIVIGLTCKNRIADIANINAVLSRKFGSRYLNVRDYILEYGLADAEITPTTQDEIDIANGEMPTSLRADTVHFNQYGYKIIAKLVYQKGLDLGYWE